MGYRFGLAALHTRRRYSGCADAALQRPCGRLSERLSEEAERRRLSTKQLSTQNRMCGAVCGAAGLRTGRALEVPISGCCVHGLGYAFPGNFHGNKHMFVWKWFLDICISAQGNVGQGQFRRRAVRRRSGGHRMRADRSREGPTPPGRAHQHGRATATRSRESRSSNKQTGLQPTPLHGPRTLASKTGLTARGGGLHRL